jgi:phage-related protein
MTTSLPFTNKITVQSDKTLSVAEVSAQFGDGYSQVAGRGVKPVRDLWDITLSPLTRTEVTSFESFLGVVGIWGLISWTPPWETVEKQFKLVSVKRTESTPNLFIYNLSLREV